MTACPWEEIHGFRSPGELIRFETWMSEQVAEGIAKEVPVDKSKVVAPVFTEKWLMHVGTASVGAWFIPTPRLQVFSSR